ncbi:hypothetical protein KKP97_00315 [Methanothermococcus sp. SCGC AD-155-C09]|nr:hypothetical protein [Methanothermococcus sp. SCGC AD-155-C09]
MHLHFNGVIKHSYTHFIEGKLFPKIRYNKLLYISTGKKHINYSQGKKDFTKRLKEENVIGDKGYIEQEVL